ncbi:MAG: hypothetical protein GY856_35205, partial [bacterium]|nr:hypothetical protein [bacterium]
MADKLMRVVRRNGEAGFVMIHSEIQASRDYALPERTYIYNYRIYDRYHVPVASFVILGDDSPKWRPDHFKYEIWGCRPELHFPVIKLLDYNDRWAELESSANPFAMVAMAHLKTRATPRQWSLLVSRLGQGKGGAPRLRRGKAAPPGASAENRGRHTTGEPIPSTWKSGTACPCLSDTDLAGSGRSGRASRPSAVI